MRKVVSFFVYALDGAVDNPQNWVFDNYNTEVLDFLAATIAEQDAVLLGRAVPPPGEPPGRAPARPLPGGRGHRRGPASVRGLRATGPPDPGRREADQHGRAAADLPATAGVVTR